MNLFFSKVKSYEEIANDDTHIYKRCVSLENRILTFNEFFIHIIKYFDVGCANKFPFNTLMAKGVLFYIDRITEKFLKC